MGLSTLTLRVGSSFFFAWSVSMETKPDISDPYYRV